MAWGSDNNSYVSIMQALVHESKSVTDATLAVDTGRGGRQYIWIGRFHGDPSCIHTDLTERPTLSLVALLYR
jgi:hypothetical protein